MPSKDEKVWVFRRGREEFDGFDDEIVVLIYDGHNEFRSMDFASAENINNICTIDMRQITHWKPFCEIETPLEEDSDEYHKTRPLSKQMNTMTISMKSTECPDGL